MCCAVSCMGSQERKQHADEGKVLRSVEATLVSVRAGMRASADSVALVVQQVNNAQAQFKAEKQVSQVLLLPGFRINTVV